MRLFRFVAVAVLLLACVVMGSACAGAKGEQGPKGDTGADGVGIENIVNNGDGTFTVNLTNGVKYTTDNLTGPQGVKGDTGTQGVQGELGPSMIVAMGNINSDGTVSKGYNITSSTWNDAARRYEIRLTGINYQYQGYVTLVTPEPSPVYADYGSYLGMLVVGLRDSTGTPAKGAFSFMVLECP
jgi:hypothetical protein